MFLTCCNCVELFATLYGFANGKVIVLNSLRLAFASACLALSTITPHPPEPAPPSERMTAAVASRPVLMPQETTTTTLPPLPPPTTTTTAPQLPPEPLQAPPTTQAPQVQPAPSGDAVAAIRRAFSPYGQSAVDIALRVARCESRMDPHALSDSGTYAGLFQIGNFWAEDFLSVTGMPYYDGRFDALANAAFAAWLAYEAPGGGWQHWSCY